MTILIVGATGYIGKALLLRLLRDRHRLIAATRSPARARKHLGPSVELFDFESKKEAWWRLMARCDAVIHVAGSPVLPKRWTQRRKRALTASRVGVGDRISDAISDAPRRPAVFITASAVGYYGDRGEELADEASEPGHDFLAEMCVAWESAAARVEERGVRVVRLRFGVVLGPGATFVRALSAVFQSGLGGPIGSGRQFVSWIHIEDLAEVVVKALEERDLRGPVNCVAPRAVRNRELSKTVASLLRRPAWLRVPSGAVRVALGEAADAVLASQRVDPVVLRDTSFLYQYPTLAGALANALGREPLVQIERTRSWPDVPYLQDRPPRYRLATSALVTAPLGEVFAFFATAENLGLLTPSNLSISIRTGSRIEIGEDTRIDYMLRLFGMPLRWRTGIERWEPEVRFADAQRRGPFRSWWHEHLFTPSGHETMISDRVYYAPPLGPLGSLANRWFVAPTLREIFAYRRTAMVLRFGHPPAGASDAQTEVA